MDSLKLELSQLHQVKQMHHLMDQVIHIQVVHSDLVIVVTKTGILVIIIIYGDDETILNQINMD